MLAGILSDTHDHLPHANEAADIFKQRSVDLVLHAGDYCSPFMIPVFEGLPFKGILGNNDGDKYLLMRKFDAIGGELLGTFGDLTLDNRRIALYHGTDTPVTKALEHSGHFDVVISGHTHDQKAEQVNDTLSINPGTAHGFGEQATIALLDTASLEVEFVTLA